MSKSQPGLISHFRKSWAFLSPIERRKGFLLLAGSFLIIGLDLLSLAAILPVVLLVLNPDSWQSTPLPDFIIDILTDLPLRKMQIGILGGTFILFLVKNSLAYVIQKRKLQYYEGINIRLGGLAYEHIIDGITLQAYLEKHGGEDAQQLIFIPGNFVNKVFKGYFSLITEGLLMMVIIATMLWFDPWVFLTAFLALTPGIAALVYIRRKNTQRIGGKMKLLFNNYLQYVGESIHGYLDITIAGRKDYFLAEFLKRSHRFRKNQVEVTILSQSTPRVVEVTALFGILCIIFFLIYSNASLTETTFTLGVYLAGAFKLIPSINSLLTAYIQLNAHRYTIDEIEGMLPTIQEQKPLKELKNQIVLNNASFAYSAQSFGLVELNMTLNKGEKTALVGPSGEGKTTLIHLLLGLFRMQTGELRVDHTAIDLNNARSWRKQISYVAQNPLMLEASLLENIAFGIPREEIDVKKVIKIIKEVELESLVAQLKDGIGTTLGEGAKRISAGQRQRVALARALYQDRPIMIFDEVTANLDEDTEVALLDTLIKVSHHKKTMLFISHRPQILEHCDAVWELKNGKLNQVR